MRTLLGTVLYPSDCYGFLLYRINIYPIFPVLIGIRWVITGLMLLMGGSSDSGSDNDISCIAQSLISNDKRKRESRRSTSAARSSIFGSSLEIGEAESPLLQSAEEEIPIPISSETISRRTLLWQGLDDNDNNTILNEDNLEVRQEEEDLARAQEALHNSKKIDLV